MVYSIHSHQSWASNSQTRIFPRLWGWKRLYMSRRTTKPTKWPLRPAKTQISLGIRPLWSESPPCAQWVDKKKGFFLRTAKTDQTGRMPRLIWVFAGRTSHFVGFVFLRLVFDFYLFLAICSFWAICRTRKLKYTTTSKIWKIWS